MWYNMYLLAYYKQKTAVERRLESVLQSILLPKCFIASLQMSAPFSACTSVHCDLMKFSVLARVWPYAFAQIL